ncbi:unnamed protein product [Merluccius merluccius]
MEQQGRLSGAAHNAGGSVMTAVVAAQLVQGERTAGTPPTPPEPVVDSQTPGPSSAGAEGLSTQQTGGTQQEEELTLTPQQSPTNIADEGPEITALLEDSTEEDVQQTAGILQLQPARQPERSGGKHKAKSNTSQGGGRNQWAVSSLERNGGEF